MILRCTTVLYTLMQCYACAMCAFLSFNWARVVRLMTFAQRFHAHAQSFAALLGAMRSTVLLLFANAATKPYLVDQSCRPLHDYVTLFFSSAILPPPLPRLRSSPTRSFLLALSPSLSLFYSLPFSSFKVYFFSSFLIVSLQAIARQRTCKVECC